MVSLANDTLSASWPTLEAWTQTHGKTEQLWRQLEADANPLLELQIHRPSLEDVFIELTGRPWAEPVKEGDR